MAPRARPHRARCPGLCTHIAPMIGSGVAAAAAPRTYHSMPQIAAHNHKPRLLPPSGRPRSATVARCQLHARCATAHCFAPICAPEPPEVARPLGEGSRASAAQLSKNTPEMSSEAHTGARSSCTCAGLKLGPLTIAPDRHTANCAQILCQIIELTTPLTPTPSPSAEAPIKREAPIDAAASGRPRRASRRRARRPDGTTDGIRRRQ